MDIAPGKPCFSERGRLSQETADECQADSLQSKPQMRSGAWERAAERACKLLEQGIIRFSTQRRGGSVASGACLFRDRRCATEEFARGPCGRFLDRRGGAGKQESRKAGRKLEVRLLQQLSRRRPAGKQNTPTGTAWCEWSGEKDAGCGERM